MNTKRSIKLLNLFVIFLMLFSPLMQGVTPAVAQDRAGGVVEVDGSVSTGTADGAGSVSFGHTTGTGDDRLLLVGVSWNSGSDPHPITTAYFNDGSADIPMSVVHSEMVEATSGATGPRYAAILSLLAPPSGVSGTVTVNFDGTVQYGIVATAVNFKDVDQATPLGTPQGANGDSSSEPSVSLSGLNGDELVFDTAFLGGSGDSYTLDVGADQTELWNTFNSYARSAGSIEQAAGSDVTMSWGADSPNWWAQVAVPINPAASVPVIEASASSSDALPMVGDQITVTININMDGAISPNDFLGSFSSSLSWNPAVLSYNSDLGIMEGYTGAINPGSDFINFNGAKTVGETGSIDIFMIIFDVIGEGDAGLDLSFSAMAADTDESILAYLTVEQASVIADAPSAEVLLDGAYSSDTANSVDSIDFEHTTGTGTNRLTLVGVAWNSGSNERNISSVTFSYGAGPTVLNLVEVIDAQASSARNSAIYKIDGEPPAGETGTMTVNFSGSVSNGIVAGAANFANVDPVTPLGTPGSATDSSASSSLTLTGLEGDELIFDNLFQGASGETQTIAAGSGQIELWNAWIGNARSGSSYKQATSDSVAMGWTANSSSVYVLTAVPINPGPLLPPQYTITASAGANGSISPDGDVLVDEGVNQTFLISPNSGFEIDDVLVDGSSVGALASYEFVDVGENHTISASFQAIQHTITASAGANGSISPSGAVPVDEGANQTFLISPNSGFEIDDVLVDGSSVGALTSYEFVAVDEDHTISASFTAIQHTITASAGANGSISPDGAVLVNEGANQTFLISPNSGFEIDDVLVDGSSVGALASYEFVAVDEAHTISASFTAIQHTITASAGLNGSISPDGAVLVNEGDNKSFSITPDSGYQIADVLVDSVSEGAIASYEFTNVDADHTIEASFSELPPDQYTISASAGANGSISPSGSVLVTEGDDQTFLISPNSGFEIADVLVDGSSVGALASYEFVDVGENHTISASFQAIQHTITASAGLNGSISPDGDVLVNEGDDQTFLISPNSGFEIADVLVDGLSVGALASYEFADVDEDHTISASFTAIQHTITASAGANGSISPDGAVLVNEGANQTFLISPASGFEIDDVLVDGSSVGALASYEFVAVDEDHTISASFTAIQHTITASAGLNGSISPDGAVLVNEGDNQTFLISPDSGYLIEDVLVDGASEGALASYEFTNVVEDHTISASFIEDIPESVVASAVPSDTSPDVGESITVTIQIDMTGMDAPDDMLGSFTSSLSWNPAILSYDSNSGLLEGFTGAINPGSGLIQFNAAKATGVGGSFDVFTVTFNVIGAGDAALNLGFTAMASDTGNPIMDYLSINQGSVVSEGVPGVVEMVSSSQGIGDGTDVMSFSHTTGTGANRLMLVGVSWNSGDAAENIESVVFSYGSTELALTEVITEQATVTGDVSGPRFAAIYSLVNPPSDQAGTITITFDDSVSNGVVAGAATFKGVHQSVPLGTPVGNNGGTSSDPTVTLVGLAGNEMVFDNVFLGGADDSYTLSVGSDQTELWNDFDTNARGTASVEQAAGNSVTMSWTPGTQNWWAQVAVPINPALGGITYYDLTIAVDPSGAGTTNPAVGTNTYQEGAIIDILASPASGYEFVEWSGDCTGSGTCQVTMSGDKSVTAHFAQITHQLSVSVDPALGGTTDPAVGDHVYAGGVSVPITAMPNENYIFDHWSGDCTGSGACNVLMNADKSVTAHFVESVPGSIIYVGDIGSGSIKEVSSTLTITTTDPVLEGDDIVVGYVTGPNPTLEVAVTDSAGNTYEMVERARNYEYGRAYLFVAYDVEALPAASEIVITATIDPEGEYDYPEARAAVVSVFRGLDNDAPFDQTLGNPVFDDELSNDATATPFVGPTDPTTQADALVIGLIGTMGPVGDDAGSWDYGFTDLQRAGTSGGDADSNWTISMGFRSVSVIDEYTAQKSGVTSRRFAAVIATFKADLVPDHTLTISADPAAGGTTNPGVGSHDYDEGSLVDIDATPATGYEFDHWSGDCTGSGACQVTMDADMSVTAHFVVIEHTLSLGVDPSGAGTTSPAEGDHSYDYGSEVTVTAQANAGFEFAYWSGDCTGSGACEVTMDGDMSVVAHFTRTTFGLNVLVDPAEGGTTVPSAGVHQYLEDTEVAVVASPAAGYEFDHWSGACTGSGLCSVIMDADKTVTAHFEPIMYDLTVTIDPAGGGTTSPAEGVHAYVIDSEVSVVATPDSDYLFVEWTGDCTGSGACDLVMDGDKAVTAHFELKSFDLSIEVEPAESGTTDPAVGSHTYDIGSVVPIVPTPAAGYEFAYWSGDCTGTGACEVIISEDMYVMAHFVHKTYDLTITVDPAEGGTTTPAAGVHPYLEGTPVVIVADPAVGFEFDSWSGACTGSDTCTVTMDDNKSVTANFRAITYDLTVNVAPEGGGTTTPAEGVHSYAIGTPVSVTAEPANHYLFVEWSGDCAGSGACDLTMDGAKEVTANFELEEFDLSLSVDPVGAGTLDPAVGTHAYAYGSVVDVIPTPAAGYEFAYWTGDCSGTGSCQVTIDEDMDVQAHFMTATYDLTIIVDPAGSGTTIPSEGVHPYLYDSEVNIAANPEEGFVFISWSGDCTGTGACNLVMDGDKTVTAHFEEPKDCYVLTISSTGEGALPIADPPNSDGCGAGEYEPDTVINLTASPEAGWHVDSWYGTDDDSSTSESNSFTMPASIYEVGVNYMVFTFIPVIIK